jgi:sterol desaturase/sphingolipid hydroxylase (fatty acid hydroxylase superfamily)
MHFEKIHNKGQAQLFRNKYLEALTKTHPLIIWGMYTPLMIASMYWAGTHFNYSPLRVWGTFFIAIFSWTLFEYFAHRFLFHMVADSGRMQRFIYVLHGNHHHYPRDRQRLFMPPVPSILLAVSLFSIFYLLMGNNVFMFFPGFLLGYLLYGTMHYAIHAWNPPFKWMKPLWRNHHLHHYKAEERGFGVSTTIWDRVFGTMYDLKKEKEDKEKTRELMFQR